MRFNVFWIVLLSVMGCATGERQSEQAARRSPQPPDTTVVPPPPPGGPSQSAVIKDNRTMIGSVILSIELVDVYKYTVHVVLRTALPAGSGESLAEPGQELTLSPSYTLDSNGRVVMEDARNKRLYDVRAMKKGEALLGRITLHQDGVWYLFDTTLE